MLGPSDTNPQSKQQLQQQPTCILKRHNTHGTSERTRTPDHEAIPPPWISPEHPRLKRLQHDNRIYKKDCQISGHLRFMIVGPTMLGFNLNNILNHKNILAYKHLSKNEHPYTQP
jgi:hypothetical protein